MCFISGPLGNPSGFQLTTPSTSKHFTKEAFAQKKLVVNATRASLFIYLYLTIDLSYEISKGFEEFFWSTFLLFGFSHKLVQTKKMTSFGPLSQFVT